MCQRLYRQHILWSFRYEVGNLIYYTIQTPEKIVLFELIIGEFISQQTGGEQCFANSYLIAWKLIAWKPRIAPNRRGSRTHMNYCNMRRFCTADVPRHLQKAWRQYLETHEDRAEDKGLILLQYAIFFSPPSSLFSCLYFALMLITPGKGIKKEASAQRMFSAQKMMYYGRCIVIFTIKCLIK